MGCHRPRGYEIAREINRLTTAKVKHAKPGLHPDGGQLFLQVTESKTNPGQLNRSWLFKFRGREMGLGSLKTVGLAEAREHARKWRQVLAEGRDPIEVRAAQKASRRQATAAEARTFEKAALAYMAAHEPGWRHATHRAVWNQTLRDFAFPHIGALPVDQISTPDILKSFSRSGPPRTRLPTS
jgi:hypothetical protein